MLKKILKFCDKLEDKVRGRLSHYPIVYAVIGGIGTVLFWRGIWHIADFLSLYYFSAGDGSLWTINLPSFIDGVVSSLIGLALLLTTGLFVATFIGDHILVSGLKHEKKLAEKTEKEVEEEENIVRKVHEELHSLSKRLDEISAKLDKKL